jgi:predicted Ser/Thr protein kinase
MVIGDAIGPYHVLAKLGEGGMGAVYRARDVRLNRDVAIKVLPAAFERDPDRLARLTREAQVLAALNHPNIAHLYGLEDLCGSAALVMEFVEGRTLESLLGSGAPLLLAEVVAAGQQIAAGLEAAHEKSIIHRDLKPANIMLAPGGHLKILDFGLAKSAEAAASAAAAMNSPTLLSPVMTTQGLILGTGAYMSPEQARGRPVDKRSDIWAFGVVLWEMVTGRRLFARDNITDTLAAIVGVEPPWTELPDDLPDDLRRLLVRCLAKDPQRRLRDIGEARIALEDPAILAPGRVVSVQNPAGAERRRSSRTALAIASAAALVLLVFAAWLVVSPRGSATGALMSFDVDIPQGTGLRLAERPALEISPNGNVVAFAAGSDDALHVFVRGRDESVARKLPIAINTARQGGDLAFSSDGRFLAVTDGTSVAKVPLDGGPLVRLAPVLSGTRGIAWADRTIVYSPAPRTGLYAVNADGGEPRELTKVSVDKGERSHRWPVALPGGKAILFTVGALGSPDSYDDADIDALVLATGERRRILQGASFARYAPGRRLIIARGGSLYSVGFDPERLTVTGAPVLVAQQVARDPNTGAVHFAIAQDGTLVYVAGTASEGLRRPVWVDRTGATEPIDLQPDVYNDPSISPDGRRVALLVGPIGHGDIWIYDFTQTTFTRVTSDGRSATPVWSADGRSLYYASIDTPGRQTFIMRRAADGSGDTERVTSAPLRAYVGSIIPDPAVAVGAANRWVGSFNVVLIPLQAGQQVATMTETRTQAYAAEASPDRKWIAYTSEESGRREVYVQSLVGANARKLISTAGGEEPHWAPDGRTLYYRLGDRLMAVPIQTGDTVVASKPVLVLRGMYDLQSETGLSYAIDPRTGRFLMLRLVDDQMSLPHTSFRVVLNWAAHLQQRAASPDP